MKKKISAMFAMAALALTLTSTASFAAKGEWFGGGQAGVHIPSGDYGDEFKLGWLGGVYLDYGVTEMFTLGANLDFHQAKGKDDFVRANNLDDLTVSLFNYGVNGALAFMPEAVWHPYVKAGVGMYQVKAKAEAAGVSGETDESDFGVAGGGGFMVHPAANPVGFGVEALIHNVMTEGESTQFFSVTGRITFSFSDRSQVRTTTP